MNSAMRDTTWESVPDRIQQLQAGVPVALALLAGMQLDVFTHLGGGSRDAPELAEILGVQEARLSRLLYALVVAGLLERRHGRFANTPEAADLLVKGRPGYLGGMHELLSQLWAADLQTAQSIRSGRPAALHDYGATADGTTSESEMSESEMEAMLRGMHPSCVAAGRDLARRFNFAECRSIVDIGGGTGGLVAALCHANPLVKGVLFDLPRVAAVAAPILEHTPGGVSVSIEGGNIVEAPPRDLHDAVLMRAVIQVLPPADAARAIANAAIATRTGGKIYIMGGGILENDRVGPPAAVLLNVTFMNLYPAGGAYTIDEHEAWLTAAGYGEMTRTILPNGGSILRATKLP